MDRICLAVGGAGHSRAGGAAGRARSGGRPESGRLLRGRRLASFNAQRPRRATASIAEEFARAATRSRSPYDDGDATSWWHASTARGGGRDRISRTIFAPEFGGLQVRDCTHDALAAASSPAAGLAAEILGRYGPIAGV
jgi:hypothetical protein